MRALLALLVAAPALAGCTALDGLDPMTIACREAAVQEAGWCVGVPGAGAGADGGLGGTGRAGGPVVEATASGVRWSHTMEGAHDRFTFAFESPGKARVSWSGAGSGGMRVAVRDAAGAALYSSPSGALGGAETLAGRPGSWSVVLEFDNFAGQARAELARA